MWIDIVNKAPETVTINYAKTILECPISLSVTVICETDDCNAGQFVKIQQMGELSFSLSLEVSESTPGLGRFQLSIKAVDEWRNTESETKLHNLVIINSCATQQLVMNGVPNSLTIYDLLSDEGTKTLEIAVVNTLPSCSAELALRVVCDQQNSQDCSERTLPKVSRISPLVFTIDIAQPSEDTPLGFYLYSLYAVDTQTGKQSNTELLRVQLKDSCAENNAIAISGLPNEQQALDYDIRAAELLSYDLTVV